MKTVPDMDFTNIDRPILPQEATNTAHVIPIIVELLATENVHLRGGDVMNRRSAVKVFAVLTTVAKASGLGTTNATRLAPVSSPTQRELWKLTKWRQMCAPGCASALV